MFLRAARCSHQVLHTTIPTTQTRPKAMAVDAARSEAAEDKGGIDELVR